MPTDAPSPASSYARRLLTLGAIVVGFAFFADTPDASATVGTPPRETAVDASATSLLWRRPGNDGLNCLYLLLRDVGYTGRYEDYLAAVAQTPGVDRFGGLSRAARSLGYDLSVTKLTMTDLENLRRPVLVHLEREGLETGYFGLVAGFDRNDEAGQILLIHGGTATVDPVPRDTFRREWGGYALTVRGRSGWLPTARRVAAALMIACVVAMFASFFGLKG